MLKQLYFKRKVLILDEPTSVLTPDEADEVLGMVRDMCTQGRLSVLMITHKFREVMAFCDEVTVLRHGKFIGEGSVRDLEPKEMAEMMMGTATPPEQAARSRPRRRRPRASAGDPRPPRRQRDRRAGPARPVAGSPPARDRRHRRRLRQRPAAAGAGAGRPAGEDGGAIKVHGEDYRATREEIRRHHFHVLPEMPLQNACVGIMTTGENLAFRNFDRPPMTWGRWFVSAASIRRRAEELIGRYRIRPPWPSARIGNLSGGNVQRAVLARELGEDVQVLVAANPCFGLDFKAVAEIRSQIMQARNRGAAVLLVSEDLDEILELADRILVISDGQIVYETRDRGGRPPGHRCRHMAGH